MPATIASAYVQILPSMEGVQEQLSSALGDAADSAGKAAGEKAGSGFGTKLASAAKIGGAAIAAVGTAAGAAVSSLIAGTGAVAEYGDNIDKMSQKLGLSATSYQEWDYVLGQAGTNIDNMSVGLKTLTNKIDDAKNGSASAQDLFDKLGISLEELETLSREDIFAATISGLQGMADSTERAALANDLFGKSGQELTPLFNTSVEETNALRAAAHDLGFVLSDESVSAAADYQDALDTLQRTFGGLKNNLTSEFMPSITTVMDGLTQIFSGDSGGVQLVTEGINDFISALSSHIPEIMEVGTGILTALIDAITENLPTLLSSGVDMIMTISTAIIENLPMLIEAALQVILQLAMGIAESLPELIPTIVDVVIQIVETLIDNVDMLIDSAIAIILALADGLIDALPRLIEKAPEIILKLLMALVENAPKLLEAGIELLGKVGEGIVSVLGSIVDIGRQIVEGIWQGISNAAGWLWDKVTGWVGGLVGGIKDTLGIASPSKVFAEIGENMGLGIGEGFTGAMRSVRRDIENAIPTDLSTQVNEVENNAYRGLYGVDMPEGNTTNQITINVYPSEGMDERELAMEIERRLMIRLERRLAAWA